MLEFGMSLLVYCQSYQGPTCTDPTDC